MNERSRTEIRSAGSPAGGGGIFDAVTQTELLVTISSGPYIEQLPVANSTVGEVRRRFGGRFDIDPEAQAFLDGQAVGNETVIRTGQNLMFSRRAGEKGRCPARLASTRDAGCLRVIPIGMA
jgi:hypothetical protein